MTELIGKRISHYRILEKVGQGGMGVVYKAEDTKLKRTVVLKFLTPQALGTEEEKSRFVHEAQAAAALNHSNICTVYEIDESEGQSFIAMEYIEGESLKEKVELGPLKLDELMDIAMQVCEALQKAHDEGVVHRDIKSGNIMITTDGVAKIMDFGLAKLAGRTRITKTGMTMGTVAYMSPEQARGESIDHRTDIWSLGVVLYEMVTGQLPFKGDYEQAVMYSIMNEEPEPMTGLRTGVPMELERITDKTLAKSPDERYQHVDEMLVDLRSVKKDLESRRIGTKARPSKARPARRKRAFMYGALVVILLILLIVSRLYFLTGRSEGIESLAVLPLTNLSGDPEQEYFADGMTEALITEISKIGALKVISRTSVMRYKQTQKSLPEIARALNVDAVVEGSVLRVGDRVRVTTQLIHAATDEHLWAENYDRDLRDVLALHSEVARTIARAIKITVTPEEQARLAHARPVDSEAYELYLRGRRHQDRVTEDDLKKSIEYFNQALEKDPDFASAFLGLAESYVSIVWQGGSSEEALSKFRTYALKAIELDKTLDEAHYLLGEIKLYNDWDVSGAEIELKRALELNPNSARAHGLYSYLLQMTGRMDEAVAEQERALEIDPLSHYVACSAGFTYYQVRRYDRAIEQARKTTELFGPACAYEDLVIGQAYDQKGMYGNAIAQLEKRGTMSKDNARIIAGLGISYALSGQANEAHKIIEELKELATRKSVDPYVMAPVYVALGDKDEAFRLLEKAYERRSYFLLWVNVDPRLDPLRDDPRFQDLLRRMNIPG